MLPLALDLHLMPHCRNLAGHCPDSRCYGDCLFPEGSAPRFLKADHQIKGLGIKQALLAGGSCLNQTAKDHILFSLAECTPKSLPEYAQGSKQAVMWFAITYRMQGFLLLKPQITICVWHFSAQTSAHMAYILIMPFIAEPIWSTFKCIILTLCFLLQQPILIFLTVYSLICSRSSAYRLMGLLLQ